MPISIKKCTDTFNAFAKFAQEKVDAGERKAVLDAKFNKPLEGHRILAIGTSETDEVHKWTRGFDEWTVNDLTKEVPEVVDVTFSQTFTPDEVAN